MYTREEIISVLKSHLPEWKREYGVKKLTLFGSVAKGDAQEGSDIDIIAEFDSPIGLRFVEFAEQVESLLGMKADLLTPEGVRAISNSKITERIRETAIDV